MRGVRLKGSTLGFIDVFGKEMKEMKESEVGKIRKVAEEKFVELIGWKGSFG